MSPKEKQARDNLHEAIRAMVRVQYPEEDGVLVQYVVCGAVSLFENNQERTRYVRLPSDPAQWHNLLGLLNTAVLYTQQDMINDGQD